LTTLLILGIILIEVIMSYKEKAIKNLKNLVSKVSWIPDEKELSEYEGYISGMSDSEVCAMESFKRKNPTTREKVKEGQGWKPILWDGNPLMEDFIEAYALKMYKGHLIIYRRYGKNGSDVWSGVSSMGANSSASYSTCFPNKSLAEAKEWFEHNWRI
jgi:hypothetical protein